MRSAKRNIHSKAPIAELGFLKIQTAAYPTLALTRRDLSLLFNRSELLFLVSAMPLWRIRF